jgi:DtxR family Mn-dependent transcriptional regulator
VLPLPEAEAADGVKTLADFKPGERATVLGLARSCRGPERRRLLDLGFVAGTAVEVEMISPSGEPTAYRVRGTVIALHREQARLVLANNAGEVTS